MAIALSGTGNPFQFLIEIRETRGLRRRFLGVRQAALLCGSLDLARENLRCLAAYPSHCSSSF
jgi:hypothetical protein